MKSIFFPVAFFDEFEIADLPAELKLMLGGCACHTRQSACGVITLTDFVISPIGFSPSVALGIACELNRRGVAIFDPETREFFIRKSFNWHKTPSEAGANSPWSNQVISSLEAVRSEKIKQEVKDAIAKAPAEKMFSISVPANLLSSFPIPGLGKKWSASALLVLFCCYTNPMQTASGFFIVDFDAMGAFCSLPPDTVREILRSLDAAKVILFDEISGEIFLPNRLKNASARERPAVEYSGQEIRCRRLKIAFSKQFFRTFGKKTSKSMAYDPPNVILPISNTTTNCGGFGGVVNIKEDFHDLLVMMEEQGKLLGKRNPGGWAAKAVARMDINGLSEGEACQLAAWRLKRLATQQQKEKQDRKDKGLVKVGQKGMELVGKKIMGPNGKILTVSQTGLIIAGKTLPLVSIAEKIESGDFKLAAN